MDTLIVVLVVLFAIAVMIKAVSRSKEQFKGHNRCAYCRTHLRRSEGGTAFATTCRKCGRDQPWATSA